MTDETDRHRRGHDVLQEPTEQSRAQVQLVDTVITFLMVVSIVVLAPTFYVFIEMLLGPADAFSGLLLRLTLPILFIALILSVGVSARRGGI